MIEFFHCVNSLYSNFFLTGIAIYSHYIFCESGKTRQTVLINITCPAWPDSSKTCTMCYIKHASKFMFQFVRHKISTIISTSCQIIMSNASRPHYLSSGLIIFRLRMQYLCIFHNCSKQSFRKRICNFHITSICKIPLHCVHHNIYTAGFCLIIRQSFRQLRIHNCKFRTGKVIIIGTFCMRLFIRDYTSPGSFTACCRNC